MTDAADGGARRDRRRRRRAAARCYHEAVELIGRRWTGAIVAVLLASPRPLRFSEIGAAVPDLSDRLLSERMKELEERGLVVRHVDPGPPVRVTYAASEMGRDLEPALEQVGAAGHGGGSTAEQTTTVH